MPRSGMIGRVSPEGEEWQLGHRIQEPCGQAQDWWELHPVTLVRPGAGETTTRLLCATCDEAVDCVVVSEAGRRRRRWRTRAVSVAAASGAILLTAGSVGGVTGMFVLGAEGKPLLAAASGAMGLIYYWLTYLIGPHIRPWGTTAPGDEDVRLVSPSPVHELRPPSRRSEIPAPDQAV